MLNSENSIFNKIIIKVKEFIKIITSIKVKIIIALILCLISIGVIVKSAVDNNAYNKNLNKHNNNTQITLPSQNGKVKINEQSSTTPAAQQSLQLTEDQKKQEEKQKELEKKYELALNEYYGSEDKKADVISITSGIINEDDKFYKAYSLRGLANCFINITEENYKNGLADIDKALQLKPDYGYGLFCKALALELYAHYDEALNWYDKALEALKSENNTEFIVWTYFGQSSIYGRRGDVQNCTRLLKMAINLNPSAKQVAIDEENSDFKNVKDSIEFKNLVK